jgi:hypothetical protein
LDALFSSYGPQYHLTGWILIYGAIIKSTVHAAAGNDVGKLKDAVESGCELIRKALAIFERMRHKLIQT